MSTEAHLQWLIIRELRSIEPERQTARAVPSLPLGECFAMSLEKIDTATNDPDDRMPSAPDLESRESDDRRRGARDSPSLMMLVLVATIGVLLYTTFLFDFSNRGNWIPYLLVLTPESVIIVQA